MLVQPASEEGVVDGDAPVRAPQSMKRRRWILLPKTTGAPVMSLFSTAGKSNFQPQITARVLPRCTLSAMGHLLALGPLSPTVPNPVFRVLGTRVPDGCK